jgi:uncharacterized membrane protein
MRASKPATPVPMTTAVQAPALIRTRRPSTRGVAIVSLGMVLAATVLTFGAGVAMKAHCASGHWADGRQFRDYCYSDIVPLYRSESLAGGRLPYLNACQGSLAAPCDEYPPLTMYYMRLAAWVSHSTVSFFWANVLGLGALALVTAWLLYRLVGRRALYFALAPTLFLFGSLNWDLLAVALTTGATVLFLRRKDVSSGILLGLGIAAKVYPALVLAAFAFQRWREGRRRSAAMLVAAAGAAWVAVDLPFMILSFRSWATFFRVSATRGALWDSVWYIGCSRYTGSIVCTWLPRTLAEIGVGFFVVVVGLAWWARARRNPNFPLWTLGFPLIAAALLANKFYSPQFSLWLLPWFALAVPNLWTFILFEVADLAVFFTEFGWFGRLVVSNTIRVHFGPHGYVVQHLPTAIPPGYHGLPLGPFEVAVMARAAILLAAIMVWATQEPLPDRLRLWRKEPGLSARAMAAPRM